MESNPIQQRIDLICEKWEESKTKKDARVIRIHCQPDEREMVDTFYMYMVGLDSPINDIAFHFDTQFKEARSYSISLVRELAEYIDVWNNSQKDPKANYVTIDWEADYDLFDEKNPAALFVKNFNNLAKAMHLATDIFAVAILKNATINDKFITWIEYAMNASISPGVKYLLHDTVDSPSLINLVRYSPIVTTIPINLNMPKAMEQIAAMGDPKDPATPYRQAFMKMMNAMEAKKEEDAEKYGRECIDIATKNLEKDPFWVAQIVMVYIALGNDKIRYKKKKETLNYANHAVETATVSKEYFQNGSGFVLLAQALMFKATVCFVEGNWGPAYKDFAAAFELYHMQNNMHLAIEACRMAGRSALKENDKTGACKILTIGARLGKIIEPEVGKGSTFAGLLELLMQTNYSTLISHEELNGIATRIFGVDWRKKIENWKEYSQNPEYTVQDKKIESV